MSVLNGIAYWLDVPFLRIELLLGSLVTGRKDGAMTWFIGFGWHVINGGCFALLYSAIFNRTRRGGSAGFGALLGIGQWVVAGAVMPFIPVLRLPHGFAWSTWGWLTFFGSLVLHISFGATVGIICESTVQGRGISSKQEFESRSKEAQRPAA